MSPFCHLSFYQYPFEIIIYHPCLFDIRIAKYIINFKVSINIIFFVDNVYQVFLIYINTEISNYYLFLELRHVLRDENDYFLYD